MTAFHAKPVWSLLLAVLLLTGQVVHYACHALHFIEERGGLRCQEEAGPHSCTGHERLSRRVAAAHHAPDQQACPLCQGQSYGLAVTAETLAGGQLLPEQAPLYEAPVRNGVSLIAAARGPPSALCC